MSQLINSTSPVPRASAAKVERAVEHANEATAAGDTFAALLAGLFAQPVAAPPPAAPAKPGLVRNDTPIAAPLGDALAEDGLADEALAKDASAHEQLAGRGTAERPANSAGALEQPLVGDATPLSVAAPSSMPAGAERLPNAETPVAMPPRGGMDRQAELPAVVNKEPGWPGDGKAGATASGLSSPMTAAASAGERRHGAPRAAGDRGAVALATTREGGVRAVRPMATDPTPQSARMDERLALSPTPGFGSLGIAWQADLVDSGAGAASTGVAVVDGIAGSAERSPLTPLDQAAGGQSRPVQQLALAIERAVNGEVRQLTIQLSPRELGTIEIALELDADRRLTVAILAERPETLELLRQDSRQLERLLAQQGVNLADAGLELGLMSQERREGREPRQPAALDLGQPTEAEASPDAGSAPPTASLDSTHRLNLSI